MPRPIFSKGGAERTDSLPGLVEAFAALPARNVVIDGELCLTTAVDPISRRDAPAAAYRELFIGFCMIETAAEPGSSMPPQTGEAAAPDPQRSNTNSDRGTCYARCNQSSNTNCKVRRPLLR